MSKETNAKFSESFKKYEESKTYHEYAERSVEFDANELILDSITDIYVIMNEINTLATKGFEYGILCDSQAKVLQQVEDEFEKWCAISYHAHKIDDKLYKSEKSKERFLMNQYPDEYWKYKKEISTEEYKLSLLKRVVKSLESYAYKLHDLKGYNISIEGVGKGR